MKDGRTWTFYASDTLNERARKMAEIALADIVSNETVVSSILPRAILRLQEVLEKYQIADQQQMLRRIEEQGNQEAT